MITEYKYTNELNVGDWIAINNHEVTKISLIRKVTPKRWFWIRYSNGDNFVVDYKTSFKVVKGL